MADEKSEHLKEVEEHGIDMDDAVKEEEDPDLEGMADELVEAIKEGGEDKDLILKLLKQYSEDVLLAALACDVRLCDVEEAYAGKWGSDEEFAQELVESCGEMPRDFPPYIHIDWERTARDLMMDYAEDNGYYFRSL
mgnify:CR=1 FL=1